MKRTLCTVMAGFFAMVFSFGELPLYACVKMNSLHAMNSCCEIKVEVKTKKNCCGTEQKAEKTKVPTLKEVCCNAVDNHLDVPMIVESELKSVTTHQLTHNFFASLYTESALSLMLENSTGNKGPPGCNVNTRAPEVPLYVQNSSYLC